ncbi:hypothetical protein BDV59DRAFT_168999 [Aspergillus ambiguus]|uniref:uncharacterized protein n=1 Tax=Aspergillus ambiguus TaxID=176160 RepID=UPI003CCCBFD6
MPDRSVNSGRGHGSHYNDNQIYYSQHSNAQAYGMDPSEPRSINLQPPVYSQSGSNPLSDPGYYSNPRAHHRGHFTHAPKNTADVRDPRRRSDPRSAPDPRISQTLTSNVYGVSSRTFPTRYGSSDQGVSYEPRSAPQFYPPGHEEPISHLQPGVSGPLPHAPRTTGGFVIGQAPNYGTSMNQLSAMMGDMSMSSSISPAPSRTPTQIISTDNTSQSRLDPGYKRRARNFFTRGRVFSVLWHENPGSVTKTNATSVYETAYGEQVFSRIRRMVVIKEYDHCAWCFAIYTYRQKGVAKNAADASKHAIIYTQGTRPVRAHGEPPMLPEALEVQTHNLEHRLDPMSRLNFGKLFTVEHNVKVLHIGKIAERSMDAFLDYARCELAV